MRLADFLPGCHAVLHFGLFAALLLIETAAPRRPIPGGRTRHVLRHFALNALNLLLYGGFAWLAARIGIWQQRHPFGLLHWLSLPSLIAVPLGLFLLDLCDYTFHRLEHHVPLLWRLHRVHHTDPGLDVTTSLRTHPLALLCSWLFMQAGLCLLGGPQWLLVLYFGIGAFVSHWQHANVELLSWRSERVLAWFINTPRVHRRHHSRAAGDAGCNFSDVLSLWDRLLGTYRGPAEDSVRFGVEGYDAPSQQGLSALLQSPRYR